MAAAPRTGAVLVQEATVSKGTTLIILQHFNAEGGDLDAECSIWAEAPSRAPSTAPSTAASLAILSWECGD